ncbi:methyltransferase [Rhodococcus maanshanensis]|nr:methyltransferase [Rhodococcus maanshanensis]MCZ4557539.1 methyltransferase [Rhodococcus maanshanensis]
MYRPQEDTWMLASALAASVTPEAEVLDFCCGSGALAMVAARAGAAKVTAVDCSSLATGVAWANARGRGLPIRVRRGGLTVAVSEGPFDVVVSNPPYVPSPPIRLVGPAGHSHRWDGGPDGRAVLGPLCSASFELLSPGGALLLVQSAVSGVELTLRELTSTGLRAAVVRRERISFGPVMRRRSRYLESAGYCGRGQHEEELVVIRADRPTGVRG